MPTRPQWSAGSNADSECRKSRRQLHDTPVQDGTVDTITQETQASGLEDCASDAGGAVCLISNAWNMLVRCMYAYEERREREPLLSVDCWTHDA